MTEGVPSIKPSPLGKVSEGRMRCSILPKAKYELLRYVELFLFFDETLNRYILLMAKFELLRYNYSVEDLFFIMEREL